MAVSKSPQKLEMSNRKFTTRLRYGSLNGVLGSIHEIQGLIDHSLVNGSPFHM